ncbi:MAG TPA: CHASE3 domain-containing protein [Luteitalea sp.]|nr:CHASE3 domain-containing protein [Luteitalea sp.]
MIRSILSRTLLLVAVPMLMLVGLLVLFWQAERRQAEATRWSLHTKDVLEETQELQTHLSDIQTGIRGYIIVREPSFLEAYRRAREALPRSLQRLQDLTADNPSQRARIGDFARRSDVVLSHYEQVITQARTGPLPVEQERAFVVGGKLLVDEFRTSVREFRAAEQSLDEQRQHELQIASRRLFTTVVGGTGAALLGVLVAGVWFQRGLGGRVASLTTTARALADGRAVPSDTRVDDELAIVDRALREMAASIEERQRATVGALADAVSLFSAADSHRAVLDVAVDRALALSNASLAICTLADAEGEQHVVAARAATGHGTPAPTPRTAFTWDAASEVMRTSHPLLLTATARDGRAIPEAVAAVLGAGDWIGAPLSDDRRTPFGVLQVVAPPGHAFREDDTDVIETLARAATVALALERSRQRLEAANADLALTNRENELFIYSVSHDLRSPLVNLEGFSRELTMVTDSLRVILDGPDVPADLRRKAMPLIEDDVTESVRFIRTAVGRLAAIIDGLLRLSRAGRVEYRIQSLDLDRIVQRIVDAMQATLGEVKGEVTFAGLPTVAGDALALEQLLANLIGNAVAYARPDVPPRIELAVEPDLARDARFTVIRVSDNGLGIPEAHLDQVFQPLRRVHPGVGRGEGMGLAIVRRIVERHQGRVWVRSQVGAGTSFFIELPLQPVEGAADVS